MSYNAVFLSHIQIVSIICVGYVKSISGYWNDAPKAQAGKWQEILFSQDVNGILFSILPYY